MEKLSWKALASAFAIFGGVFLALAALFASAGIQFWWFNAEVFELLTATFAGLAASGVGAIVGLIWGTICGAICGGILAGLYNWTLGWWK